MNGLNLKEKHSCNDLRSCIYCRQIKEINHQCRLKCENISKITPKLAFIGMEHFNHSSENCLDCFNLRSENYLFCEKHSGSQNDDCFDDPIMAIIYREENSTGVMLSIFFKP